jgi:TRAP-type mannitol/chloroaromatic compound transport system permease small subunit
VGALLALSRVIDAINERIGKWVAWAILVAVVISTANAIIRKVFDTSSNAWLEAQWYLFGAVFMLCSAWTLLSNEHIRIDIVNNAMPNWMKQAVEVVGHALFLLPFTIMMVVSSYPFVMISYVQNEQSQNAGGLVVWPSKAIILIGFIMLTAQGISELIKRIAIIQGRIPDVHAHGGHAAAAEAEAERLLQAAKEQGYLADASPAGTPPAPKT